MLQCNKYFLLLLSVLCPNIHSELNFIKVSNENLILNEYLDERQIGESRARKIYYKHLLQIINNNYLF